MALHIDISRNNPPDCKDPYWDGYDLLVSIPLWQVCNFITVLLLRKYVSEYEEQRYYTSFNYRFLPWERIKLQEQEYFAERDPEIAAAKNKAERDRMIKALDKTNPALKAAFEDEKHRPASLCASAPACR